MVKFVRESFWLVKGFGVGVFILMRYGLDGIKKYEAHLADKISNIDLAKDTR